MALGDPYVTLPDFKAYTSVPLDNSRLDDIATDAIQSASDEIEKFCNRQFNRSEEATARRFKPLTSSVVYTSDFWSEEGLIISIDTLGTRSYTTTLVAGDYELHPLDGIVDGQPGWPWYRIELINGHRFPLGYSSVRVTAKWGWEAIPDTIKTATRMQANETFAMKGAPLGVAGRDEYGSIRVKENGMVAKKLKRFVFDPINVG